MAFHQIKLGSKNFTLAPKYITGPDTAKSNDDYGFLLFRYDEDEPGLCKLYSAGVYDMPIIKYASGHMNVECNILPGSNNNYSVGSSSQKFNTMYATTFHGNLNGMASSANKVLITTQTASDDFPIIFGQSDSVTSTGVKSVHADAHLNYNPSTNVLTTTTFKGSLDGTATSANYIKVSAKTSANATYYIAFADGSLGKRSLCVDGTLHYNPSLNKLSSTTFGGNLEGGVAVTATTTNATYYVSFVNGTSNARATYVDSGLYYNPSTHELSSSGGFYERSDERMKDLQEDIEVNFSYLHNIPKKYYYWKDDATYTRHIGTSAQEVQKYYPELVNTDETGYLTMNYDKLSVVALKAIDVLHEEVTELKKENAELKERLSRLEELILNNR